MLRKENNLRSVEDFIERARIASDEVYRSIQTNSEEVIALINTKELFYEFLTVDPVSAWLLIESEPQHIIGFFSNAKDIIELVKQNTVAADLLFKIWNDKFAKLFVAAEEIIELAKIDRVLVRQLCEKKSKDLFKTVPQLIKLAEIDRHSASLVANHVTFTTFEEIIQYGRIYSHGMKNLISQKPGEFINLIKSPSHLLRLGELSQDFLLHLTMKEPTKVINLFKTADELIKFVKTLHSQDQILFVFDLIKTCSIEVVALLKNSDNLVAFADASDAAASRLMEKQPEKIANLFQKPEEVIKVAIFGATEGINHLFINFPGIMLNVFNSDKEKLSHLVILIPDLKKLPEVADKLDNNNDKTEVSLHVKNSVFRRVNSKELILEEKTLQENSDGDYQKRHGLI